MPSLRQIYSGMVLATWYKRALKETLLGKVYANKAKVFGVDLKDPKSDRIIYEQYLKAFKKGVFNYIKEDVDKYSQQTIPRKYFAGGFFENSGIQQLWTPAMITQSQAMTVAAVIGNAVDEGALDNTSVKLEPTAPVHPAAVAAVTLPTVVPVGKGVSKKDQVKAFDSFLDSMIARQSSMSDEDRKGVKRSIWALHQAGNGAVIRDRILYYEQMLEPTRERSSLTPKSTSNDVELQAFWSGWKKPYAVELLLTDLLKTMNDTYLDVEPVEAVNELGLLPFQIQSRTYLNSEATKAIARNIGKASTHIKNALEQLTWDGDRLLSDQPIAIQIDTYINKFESHRVIEYDAKIGKIVIGLKAADLSRDDFNQQLETVFREAFFDRIIQGLNLGKDFRKNEVQVRELKEKMTLVLGQWSSLSEFVFFCNMAGKLNFEKVKGFLDYMLNFTGDEFGYDQVEKYIGDLQDKEGVGKKSNIFIRAFKSSVKTLIKHKKLTLTILTLTRLAGSLHGADLHHMEDNPAPGEHPHTGIVPHTDHQPLVYTHTLHKGAVGAEVGKIGTELVDHVKAEDIANLDGQKSAVGVVYDTHQHGYFHKNAENILQGAKASIQKGVFSEDVRTATIAYKHAHRMTEYGNFDKPLINQLNLEMHVSTPPAAVPELKPVLPAVPSVLPLTHSWDNNVDLYPSLASSIKLAVAGAGAPAPPPNPDAVLLDSATGKVSSDIYAPGEEEQRLKKLGEELRKIARILPAYSPVAPVVRSNNTQLIVLQTKINDVNAEIDTLIHPNSINKGHYGVLKSENGDTGVIWGKNKDRSDLDGSFQSRTSSYSAGTVQTNAGSAFNTMQPSPYFNYRFNLTNVSRVGTSNNYNIFTGKLDAGAIEPRTNNTNLTAALPSQIQSIYHPPQELNQIVGAIGDDVSVGRMRVGSQWAFFGYGEQSTALYGGPAPSTGGLSNGDIGFGAVHALSSNKNNLIILSGRSGWEIIGQKSYETNLPGIFHEDTQGKVQYQHFNPNNGRLLQVGLEDIQSNLYGKYSFDANYGGNNKNVSAKLTNIQSKNELIPNSTEAELKVGWKLSQKIDLRGTAAVTWSNSPDTNAGKGWGMKYGIELRSKHKEIPVITRVKGEVSQTKPPSPVNPQQAGVTVNDITGEGNLINLINNPSILPSLDQTDSNVIYAQKFLGWVSSAKTMHEFVNAADVHTFQDAVRIVNIFHGLLGYNNYDFIRSSKLNGDSVYGGFMNALLAHYTDPSKQVGISDCTTAASASQDLLQLFAAKLGIKDIPSAVISVSVARGSKPFEPGGHSILIFQYQGVSYISDWQGIFVLHTKDIYQTLSYYQGISNVVDFWNMITNKKNEVIGNISSRSGQALARAAFGWGTNEERANQMEDRYIEIARSTLLGLPNGGFNDASKTPEIDFRLLVLNLQKAEYEKQKKEILDQEIKSGNRVNDSSLFGKGNGQADKAMLKGGIDLNGANLNLLIRRDGHGVPLPLLQQDWAQLSQIKGFVPNIIEIRPVTALRILSELHQKFPSLSFSSSVV